MTLENASKKIVRLLKNRGFSGFFVGGFVRDKILKRLSENLDIATDAKPDDVEDILKNSGINTKPAGKQFGTILALIDGHKIEITTFRSEGFYSDKRHPDEIRFIKDYSQDAKRRDLTINALYFNPITKQTLDPVGGINDIKGKLIRFVGDPKKRIDEDYLRMLRSVRFATQLGFKLEKNSFAAIKTRAKFIQYISGERIKAELDKILLSKNRVPGFKLLDETGLLKFIIPEMEGIKKFSHKSKEYHLEGTIFDHTLLALSKVKESNIDLIYALIFHDIGKPQTGERVLKDEGWVISTKGHADVSAGIFNGFARELAFSSNQSKTIEWLIRNHMLFTNFFKMRPEQQLKLAEHPAFHLLLRHWYYDETATIRKVEVDSHYRRFAKSEQRGKILLKSLSEKNSLIKKLANGSLIMKYSDINPGPGLGKKIIDVKVKILTNEIKNEKDLEKFLKKFHKST